MFSAFVLGLFEFFFLCLFLFSEEDIDDEGGGEEGGGEEAGKES